jgi:hypothetical protein
MDKRSRSYGSSRNIEMARVLGYSEIKGYRESVMSTYNSKKARQNLLKFGHQGDKVIGSNVYMLFHLQESGLLGKSRLATREDLEKAVQFGRDLSQNYVDVGISLMSEGDYNGHNKISLNNLVSQLRRRGISINGGKLIPFSALTQKEDPNSDYGLTLFLKDDIKKSSIRDLAKFKWNYKTSRGAVRAYLGMFGCWFSGSECWDSSGKSGRVIVIDSN